MRLYTAVFVTAFLAAGTAMSLTAQGAISTLPYDHMHLAAPDQARAVEWYRTTFGGETMAEGKDRLMFGKTRFIWMKSEAAQPSAGSAVDHVAFSVADKAPGFMTDPWGVRIEIVNDPQVRGFHHVHLRSTDPSALLGWYQQRFGGERTKFKGEDALKYGDVLLMVDKSAAAPAPSSGHAIDHLGWRVQDLDAQLETFKGIKIVQAARELQLATAKIHFAFVEDTIGAKIELVQR